MCSAASTPQRCSAEKNSRLFSTGTPGSEAVCHKNAGGVSDVTRVSSESALASASSRASGVPVVRFANEPPWVYSPLVITG